VTNPGNDRQHVVVNVEIRKAINIAAYLTAYLDKLATETGRASVWSGSRRPK
jgi:hypothetical protein